MLAVGSLQPPKSRKRGRRTALATRACCALLVLAGCGTKAPAEAADETSTPSAGETEADTGGPSTGPRAFACAARLDTPARWTRSFRDEFTRSEISDLAQDAEGNTFLAGCVQSHDGNQDTWLHKLGPDGVSVWNRVHDDPTRDSSDCFYAVTLDDQGHIYAGGTEADAESFALLLQAHDANGEPLWASREGAGDGFNYINDLAISEAGSIVAAGQRKQDDRHVFWVRAYAPDGTIAWTRGLLGEQDTLGGTARAIASAPGGDLVVAGYVTVSFESAWVVARYSEAGQPRWEVQHETPSTSLESRGVAVDTTGTAVVLQEDRGGATAWWLRAIDRGGREQWSARLSPEDVPDRISRFVLDPRGSIVLIGSVDAEPGTSGATGWVGGFGAGGRPSWQRTLGPGPGETLRSFSIGPDCSVVIAGQTGNRPDDGPVAAVSSYPPPAR